MNAAIPDDPLHAFCRHTHAAVAGRGRGPLAGLRFAAKDIYDIAGHRTGFGSPDWLRTHEPAARTAPVVQQLLDAGADLIGRAQTDELTYSLNGENAHYGTPVNVNAPGRIPGGSSSGSAAAVAGGLADFAVGSDTGGSVRAPASYCGVYGIRPTHGRITLEGACALAPSFDTAGWFARDAALLEKVGRVLLGESGPLEPGSLLLAEDTFELLEPDVRKALQPALDRVQAHCGKAQPVRVTEDGLAHWSDIFRVLQAAEVWAVHGEWVTRTQPRLGPGIRQRIEWAAALDPREAGSRCAAREDITNRMERLLAGNAVLILPTMPDIAPLVNLPAAATQDIRARALNLLCIAGLARLPQVTLPLAQRAGCPLGLSLITARGGDVLLLRLARALTQTA